MKTRIEKTIEIKASVSKVWHALTDYRQFGEWFGVKLESPFLSGQKTEGFITHPGYEHLRFMVDVQKIDPEKYFSYTWHPYAIDPKVDYSKEAPTLVEFTLQNSPKGTLLTIVESGFDKIPDNRRAEAFRMNEGGWSVQAENISKYVANKP